MTARRFLPAAFAALAFALATAANAAPAPDCTLAINGQNVHLSALRGKVVYVDFWASWCTTCLLSFPFLNKMTEQLSVKGLQVIGVGMDAKPDEAGHFLERHPAQFEIASGNNAACAKAFGVQAMPSTFIIDRKGEIRATHQGFRTGDAPGLQTTVEQLLSESP